MPSSALEAMALHGSREQCTPGTQDYAEAVRWFRKAAEQGDADAQFNLGRMYYEGQGVKGWPPWHRFYTFCSFAFCLHKVACLQPRRGGTG